MNLATLQSQTADFAERLDTALASLNMLEGCHQLAIDHICVRLKEPEAVTNLKAELTGIGDVISSVNVNGREISIIQLKESLDLGHWQTQAIELPYPKPNHSYEDGWEHVEFVLKGAQNTMDDVRDTFFAHFPHLNQAELGENYSYSEDEPQADDDKKPNPTVGLKINGVGVKFHALPIQDVVGYTLK